MKWIDAVLFIVFEIGWNREFSRPGNFCRGVFCFPAIMKGLIVWFK